MNREIVAVIPARGGSKGIPRKNLASLGGRPLVQWSIEAAARCAHINRVLVSTEDPEIAAAAREAGAEVPFLRPEDLAGDRSLVQDSVLHLLARMFETEQYRPSHYLTLYPTTPFRTDRLLESVLEPVLDGFLTSMTVTGEWVTGTSHVEVRDGVATPLRSNVSDTWVYQPAASTQAVNRVLFDDDFDHARATERYNRGVNEGDPRCARPLKLVEVLHPAELIDIDTPADLALAEEVLRAGLFLESGSVRSGRPGVVPVR